MPPSILSVSARDALAAFMRPDTLMAFDFDGVLAPIVAVRGRARIRVRTRELLTRLAQHVACIVVSGRQLADLTPRLEGIPLRMVFGNFGHEPPLDGHMPAPVVAVWVSELKRRFRSERGIVVEDKGYSVAVHYRHAPNPDEACRLIEEVLGDMRGGRVLEGLMAVMLVPKGGPTKGSTIQAARRRLGCARAVVLGDDATDEVAFISAPPDRLLSIRVGPAIRTHAAFGLEHQTDVDELLVQMLELIS